MKAKATAKMTSELNKYLIKTGKADLMHFYLIKCGVDFYRLNIGDPFQAVFDEDQESTTGLLKAIKCEYPEDFYALPQYLTTYNLRAIATGAGGDYNAFMRSVIDYMQV